MVEPPDRPRQRRLLLNGEALRIQVESPPSGGGQKYEPRSAEQAKAILLPQIVNVIDITSRLEQTLRADHHVYVEAKLLPNFISASDYPSQLLIQIGAIAVGSRADSGLYQTARRVKESATRRLILAIEDEGLDRFQRIVSDGGNNRSDQQAFEEIRKLDEFAFATPETIVIGNSASEAQGSSTWEAVLHPSTTQNGEPIPADRETLDKWIRLVRDEGGDVITDYIREVGGLTFAPIRIDTSAASRLARFNPLRALRPMPQIRPRPRFGARSDRKLLPPSQTSPILSSPLVAVFDGGVSSAPGSDAYYPFNIEDLTPELPDQEMLAHGTGVTGAALYGLTAPGQRASTPPLPVESFCVLPAPNIPGDLDGYWILDRIKETLIKGYHKIVNLSLGPVLAVEDDSEPNRWTAELDQLAWEHDVLFVVAAGNDGDADQDTGLHRVQVPADMANGLSVGACDAPPPDLPWQRAPYSSMGPGRQGSRIQPVGVQFGGVDSRPFQILQADGSFIETLGTSFAAPLVTHALAELATHLPEASSSVLRAFGVHFAERPRTRHRKLQPEIGYGRFPLSFTEELDCNPDEVHILFVDNIRRGERIGYQLPVPEDWVGDIETRFSLAYSSPVDPTQPTEYTSASLELLLRPHHLLHRLRPPDGTIGKSVDLIITSDEARNLLNLGWVPSQEPVTTGMGNSKGTHESELRDSGKWETLRHYKKSLNAQHVERPRMEVSYLSRRAGQLDRSPAIIPFALLITINDTDQRGAIYDQTARQFASLKPVQRIITQVRT